MLLNIHSLIFRLWGENYFNPTTKKWSKSKDADNKRSFNMYVLDPLYKVNIMLNLIDIDFFMMLTQTCTDPFEDKTFRLKKFKFCALIAS